MASTPFIATEVIGLDSIQASLSKLIPLASDSGIDEANKYMLDVLREYPTYKYVSRKAAYGKTWANDNQRIAVMIKLRENGDWVNGVYTPHPHRTFEFRRGWRISGRGRGSMISNSVPYGKFLMGNKDQARQPGMVGWQKIDSLISGTNLTGYNKPANFMQNIIYKFKVGIDKIIKKLGLA
jgi:hypothetical protein